MKKMSFMRRWCNEDGNKALAEGVQHYGKILCDLVNEHHGEDLVLILVAMKSSMPLWERCLDADDKRLLAALIEATMAIDVSALRHKEAHHED